MSKVPGRDRLIRTTGLVVIVLLVLVVAQACEGFVEAASAGRDASLRVRGPAASWRQALGNALAPYHRAIAAGIYLLGVLGFVVRLGVVVRALDYLYGESPGAAERGLAGFLVNLLAVLGQLALVWTMNAAVAGPGAGLAPLLLAALLALGGAWSLWAWFWTSPAEARVVRGLWRSGLVSLGAAAALVAGLVALERAGLAPFRSGELRSANAALVGGALWVLCGVEVYVQAATYGGPRRVSGARLIATGLLLVLLAAVAVGLVADRL